MAVLTPKSIAPTSWEKAVSKGVFNEADQGKTVTCEDLAEVMDKMGFLN